MFQNLQQSALNNQPSPIRFAITQWMKRAKKVRITIDKDLVHIVVFWGGLITILVMMPMENRGWYIPFYGEMPVDWFNPFR